MQSVFKIKIGYWTFLLNVEENNLTNMSGRKLVKLTNLYNVRLIAIIVRFISLFDCLT